MSRAARSERALFLAAVAILGLVATPLLHAEEHFLEEHEQQEHAVAAALALAWRAGSSNPIEVLSAALAQGHGSHSRGEGRGHHHSHGPAPAGEHGAGVLAHFTAALHAAPRLPELRRMPAGHAAPLATIAQRNGTLSYLIPEGSQGPPSHC